MSAVSTHLPPRDIMTVRERMRLAKLALMQDEDREAEFRKERRRTRRGSSIAAGMEGGSSPTTLSPVSRSILRKPSLSSFYEVDPLDPMPVSPATSVSDFGPSNYSCLTEPSISRRPSKVRFSSDHLPSAHSSPRRPSLASQTFTAPTPASPLHSDLAMTRDLLRRKSSAASLSSGLSEPFEFSLGASSVSGSGSFRPQPLRYPQAGKRLSRLSMTSSSSSSEEAPLRPPKSELRTSPPRTARSLDQTEPHSPLDPTPPSAIRPRLSTSSSTSTISTLASASTSGRTFSTSSSYSYGLPSGAEYSALLPSIRLTSEKDSTPAINRGDYAAELGQSPRSGPSPIHDSSSVIQTQPDFEAAPGTAPSRLDSIDMLMLPPIRGTAPLAIRRKQNWDSPSSARSDSPLSVDLSFPLPPARPDLAMANPGFKPSAPVLASLSESMPHPESSEAEATPTPRTALVVPRQLLYDEPPSTSGSPQPDEYSLTLALQSIGESPTSPRRAERAPVEEASRGTVEEDRQETVMPQAVLVQVPFEEVNHSPLLPEFPSRLTRTGPEDADDYDSDLDPSMPLVEAAVKSKILSPNSRLLSQSNVPDAPSIPQHTPTSVATPRLARAGSLGWSGSESEEDEWKDQVKSVTRRKRAQPTPTLAPAPTASVPSAATTNFAPKPSGIPRFSSLPTRRPKLQLDSLMRYSNLSHMSDTSTSAASTEVVTPPARVDVSRTASPSRAGSGPTLRRTNSNSSIPGNFPWGGSAPNSPSSPRASPSLPSPGVYDSLLERPSWSKSRTMPKPKRDVDGWGAPEILIDEDGATASRPSSRLESAPFQVASAQSLPPRTSSRTPSLLKQASSNSLKRISSLSFNSIPTVRRSHTISHLSLSGIPQRCTVPSFSAQTPKNDDKRTSTLSYASTYTISSRSSSDDITPRPPSFDQVPSPPSPALQVKFGAQVEDWLMDEKMPAAPKHESWFEANPMYGIGVAL